jgi:hypothetical protein
MQAAAAMARACERAALWRWRPGVMRRCSASGCMTVHGIEVCGVTLLLWCFSIFHLY